jgi:hypothetical protein
MFEVDNKPNNCREQELNLGVLRTKASTISIALCSAYVQMDLKIRSYVLRTKDYIRKNIYTLYLVK